MKKYALLLCGLCDLKRNIPEHRFMNDIGLAYDTLYNSLNFDKVDVCFYKGRPIKYNGVEIHTVEATRSRFIQEIKYYSEIVSSEDLFVIAVTNHGAIDSEACYIKLFDDDYITLYELKIALSSINCKKVAIMGQCYGGDMINYVTNNSAIITGADVGMPTYSLRFNNSYDEFFYNFFSYLNGVTPKGEEINQDYQIGCNIKTLIRTFRYAKGMATRHQNPRCIINTREVL